MAMVRLAVTLIAPFMFLAARLGTLSVLGHADDVFVITQGKRNLSLGHHQPSHLAMPHTLSHTQSLALCSQS